MTLRGFLDQKDPPLSETKAGCWELHGKPALRKNRETGGISTATTGATAEVAGDSRIQEETVESQALNFTKEQLEHIRSKTGNIISTSTPWIMDSGASEHMTSDSSKFISLFPTPNYSNKNPQINGNHHRDNRTIGNPSLQTLKNEGPNSNYNQTIGNPRFQTLGNEWTLLNCKESSGLDNPRYMGDSREEFVRVTNGNSIIINYKGPG
ncbi:hypothetical protein LIER_38094 [Lithospermum erythrorhizon]|uniref:Uncharacterized protein n=1 Tax=Lithospermum erythrorhizon TaxID=34254 RepID=A0AAV3PZ37_LITER